MSLEFNYRHLYYFWVVAKEGGMVRAADRLGMAVQTVSTQVRELERNLGVTLLKPAGRGLVLTEAGVKALNQADQIFQLGQQLPDLVRQVVDQPTIRLAVGIADGISKLVVRKLMDPVIRTHNLKLLCHEDEFDDLLADLALHRLDVVLADRAAPLHPNIKLYSHALGVSEMSWFASPGLYQAGYQGFPDSLKTLPVLLPTSHSAVRARLDHWFVQNEIAPRIVGEFEDSALLMTFGASGMGIFPAPDLLAEELTGQYDVQRIGRCDKVEEYFFAIGTEKKVMHPLVRKILPDDA